MACSLIVACSAVAAKAATIELQPVRTSDEAVESADGSVSLNKGSLALGNDTGARTVGIRWCGLAIPAGSTITAAYIRFTSWDSQHAATSVSFRAQAADSPPTFQSASRDLSIRPLTRAAVSWVPAAWSTGQTARTPDLSAVIQEVVN